MDSALTMSWESHKSAQHKPYTAWRPQAGIRSVDSSFTAPSDSSAFFTPAASLAVAGLEAAGLQPAQLQVC